MIKLEKTATGKAGEFLLSVETSLDPGDYVKYEALRNEVWGFPEDHLSGSRNMMCENYFVEGSSIFIGAFIRGPDGKFRKDFSSLAGFCYGFAGVRDKTTGFRNNENLWFYSQFTAVRGRYRPSGLGILLKEFQREIVLDLLGIRTMVCTYDPLTAINAYRNVHILGMEVEEYRVAAYGEYGGLLNRFDVPSDRLFMSWDLTKKRARKRPSWAFGPDPAGEAIAVGLRRVKGKSGDIELETVAGVKTVFRERVISVRIPRDYYLMLQETDIDDQDVKRIPLDWRLAGRKVFRKLFAEGYKIIDFIHDEGVPASYRYLLKRTGQNE